jgi:hypothetical protein
MTGLEVLDGESLDELIELVGRLKHDLGKYVAFQIRWLPPDASHEDRVQALRRDLLHTRSGPQGTVGALSVWREFEGVLIGKLPLPSGALADLVDDPGLDQIRNSMRSLAGLIPALQGEHVDEQVVVDGMRAAMAVADGCRELQRRVRAATKVVDG